MAAGGGVGRMKCDKYNFNSQNENHSSQTVRKKLR